MKNYTIEVNGYDLLFHAESWDEAKEIIQQTLPQSDVDWRTLEEVEDTDGL